ncbi:hypothetical protein A5888_003064 [Enterococcus sp. 9E7_DIV0242]|uniref:Uncharacterized protein n=2 Tax=Candidatus Enterococcus clewellii TaxID=1834193 RepID=A0AAQ3VY52_9ENTE
MKKMSYFVGVVFYCMVFLCFKVDAEVATLFRMYNHT